MWLARIPMALGLTRAEIVAGTTRAEPEEVWNLGGGVPSGAWGLVATRTRSDPLPLPFVQAHPELAALVGLPESIAAVSTALDKTLDPPHSVDAGWKGAAGRRDPVELVHDADLASALANLREQVLVAIRIGRLKDVAVVRGYVDDDEQGLRRVLEEIWLDYGAFVTRTDLRVDEWLLQEQWYRRRRSWAYRGGEPLPRRERVDRGMPAPVRVPYVLYPSGMQRTLYGTYLLHLAAHLDLAKASGPPPLGHLDEEKAAAILAPPYRDGFRPTAVHERIRSDPAAAFVERALNGIHPLALGNANPLELDLHFEQGTNSVQRSSSQRNAGTFLPDVHVSFERQNSRLAVRRLEARFGGNSWHADSPADPLWPQLLHVARSALLLAGEIDVHLVTHVLAEHVQVALHLALDADHPVRRLLGSHVEGADVINYVGDWLILGEHGAVCAATPLAAEDLAWRTATALARTYAGALTFQPRAPLALDDHYARAAGVFWAALDSYVRGSLGGTEVDEHVTNFVAALQSSAPIGREGVRAPIVVRSSEDLVQFCKFVVFQVTFLHGWVNDAQWDDGDPDLAPLAVRSLPVPQLGYDQWRIRAAPSAVNAGYQMIIAHALANFDVGLALHDDIFPATPPGFRTLISALPAPFVDGAAEDRRLDKGWLRSRLNS